MRFNLLAPLFLFAFLASAEDRAAKVPEREMLCRAIADRMDYLEVKHSVVFNRGAFQRIEFGIPATTNQTFWAVYISDDSSIYLKADLVSRFEDARIESGELAFSGPPRKDLDFPLLALLDHELGHHLADTISRRVGNGPFPNTAEYRKFKWHELAGHKFISEGIAGFFGYCPSNYRKSVAKSVKDFPVDSDEKYWNSDRAKDLLRAGGYWLVYPIIRNYGERGIAYLVTHPLDFPDGKARKAAVEYQREALRELKRASKK